MREREGKADSQTDRQTDTQIHRQTKASKDRNAVHAEMCEQKNVAWRHRVEMVKTERETETRNNQDQNGKVRGKDNSVKKYVVIRLGNSNLLLVLVE